MVLLALGETGGVWPSLNTIFGSLVVYFLISKKGERKFIPFVPLGITLSVLVASHLRDSSGDGLGSHVEQVWLVAIGGEFQPYLPSPVSGRPALFMMAVFPACGFSLESGKWVHFALTLAGGLMLGAAIYGINGSSLNSLLASLIAILQPVLLYQANTFYQDGILAAATTILFASILRIFSSPGWSSWGVLILAFTMVAVVKKIGLAQAGCLVLMLAPTFFFLHRSIARFRIYLALVLLISPLVASILIYGPLREDGQGVLTRLLTKAQRFVDSRKIDPYGTGGIHGGCGEVSPHAPVMFWKRNFAASKRGEDGRGIKPPFWFTRPELDVFSDLTPDLRFGGYGPLYATACFLALIPGVLLLATGSRRQAGWMWILAACLVLIPLTPSWWARWFPQGWWIPFAASVGFLCGPPDWQARFRWGGWLARLGLLALGLNSLLILIFTVKGYCEAEMVIRRQLAFLKNLPAPLVIETGHFAATRFWLDQKNIPYSQEKIPGNSASVVLYRTTLRVRLSDEDLKQIEQDPDHLKLLRRHKLLNLPPQSKSGS